MSPTSIILATNQPYVPGEERTRIFPGYVIAILSTGRLPAAACCFRMFCTHVRDHNGSNARAHHRQQDWIARYSLRRLHLEWHRHYHRWPDVADFHSQVEPRRWTSWSFLVRTISLRSRRDTGFRRVDGVARLSAIIGRRLRVDRLRAGNPQRQNACECARGYRGIRSWLWTHHTRNQPVRCGGRRRSQRFRVELAQFYLGRRRNGLLAAVRHGIADQSIGRPANWVRNLWWIAGVCSSVCTLWRRKARKAHRRPRSNTNECRERSDRRDGDTIFHLCLHGNEHWRMGCGILAPHRKRNHEHDDARADVFLRRAYSRTRFGSTGSAVCLRNALSPRGAQFDRLRNYRTHFLHHLEGGHSRSFPCRIRLRFHLSHLHSVAFEMVRRASQAYRGISVCAGFARRFRRSVASRHGLKVFRKSPRRIPCAASQRPADAWHCR